MFKSLIFVALALLPGWLEGHGTAAPILLPTSEFILGEDTLSPIRVIPLQNGKANLHQLVIPNHLPKGWNLSGSIIDNPYTAPAYLNIFEMIQGRVAGVWVSGSYNYYQIRIRGSWNPPLVVVDGMPFYGYDDQGINQLLRSIPPEDVDYIEVLKGVAESAIYGPGAGNGVVIIHTKRGEM